MATDLVNAFNTVEWVEMTPEERKENQAELVAAAKAKHQYRKLEKMRIDELPAFLQKQQLRLLAVEVIRDEIDGSMEIRVLTESLTEVKDGR